VHFEEFLSEEEDTEEKPPNGEPVHVGRSKRARANV
jgi:hypothetical protein